VNCRKTAEKIKVIGGGRNLQKRLDAYLSDKVGSKIGGGDNEERLGGAARRKRCGARNRTGQGARGNIHKVQRIQNYDKALPSTGRKAGAEN